MKADIKVGCNQPAADIDQLATSILAKFYITCCFIIILFFLISLARILHKFLLCWSWPEWNFGLLVAPNQRELR